MRRLLLLVASLGFAIGTGSAAIPSKTGSSQAKDSAPRPQAYLSLELLTSTGGVDFNSYLRDVYAAVKKKWYANMPSSLKTGSRGVVTIEFPIQPDGTVLKDAIKFKLKSGKTDLDDASLAGVMQAAPFAKLPEKFSEPSLQVRMTFYYNLEPPRP
jgi:TonB family protein